MKLRNLLAVSATAFTLLSCNDSDNHPAPGKGELTPITVNIKGNADTRALTGEETGATNENDINSLEFFVFNSDGSFQKYYKPASVAIRQSIHIPCQLRQSDHPYCRQPKLR